MWQHPPGAVVFMVQSYGNAGKVCLRVAIFGPIRQMRDGYGSVGGPNRVQLPHDIPLDVQKK